MPLSRLHRLQSLFCPRVFVPLLIFGLNSFLQSIVLSNKRSWANKERNNDVNLRVETCFSLELRDLINNPNSIYTFFTFLLGKTPRGDWSRDFHRLGVRCYHRA